MAKDLVVTVAGTATRFEKSVGKQVLKCAYYEKSPSDSILSRLVRAYDGFDRIIIVGGFLFGELESYVAGQFSELSEKITLIENQHFGDYGSGWSLILGVREFLKDAAAGDGLVFAEGDLVFDAKSFESVCTAEKSVVTTSPEPILSDKAVAFYYDLSGKLHYIFDTGHKALEVPEPFTGIFNSGQVWKFSDTALLRQSVDCLLDEEQKGTNLCLIQRYFGALSSDGYDRIDFKKWFNCNTVDDFRRSL